MLCVIFRENFDEVAQELKDLGASIILKDTDLKSEATSSVLNGLDQPIRLGLNCVGGRPTLTMSKYLR